MDGDRREPCTRIGVSASGLLVIQGIAEPPDAVSQGDGWCNAWHRQRTVTVTAADLVEFPAVSSATAVRVCVPFVVFFVFHCVE